MPNIDIPTPQPKQLEFMQADSLYVGYGGARGGGKSWALRIKLVIMCLAFPGMRCLLIRRTYKELYENHVQFLEILLKPLLDAKGNAHVRHDKEHSVFIFPNGSRLKYAYCSDKSDLGQFQGMEYDIIALDEATHFLEEVFTALQACLRGNTHLIKRFYLTCNPGGIGHEWVKRLFIDKQYKEDENPDDFTFIKALYTDNEFNGPKYEQFLNSLPEELRRAWMYGDWDVFVGQYFKEWDTEQLSVDRFPIPEHWIISMSIDYGLDCFAPIWYATNELGIDYIIKGLEFKDYNVTRAAEEIISTEKKLGIDTNKVWRYAPPDLWSRSSQTGQSIIDMFSQKGLVFMKADNDREPGWMAIKEKLQAGTLKVFRDAAPQLCRFMRLLQYDENKMSDVSQTPHDLTHSPDSLRYYCIMRNKAAKSTVKPIQQDYFRMDIEPPRKTHRGRINPKVFTKWR